MRDRSSMMADNMSLEHKWKGTYCKDGQSCTQLERYGQQCKEVLMEFTVANIASR